MVVFIDESGIHKQDGHSTVAVVYVEIENGDKFQKDFEKIMNDLRIRFFHWTDERWLMREKFLSKIMNLDFRVKVAVFKNPINQGNIMETVFSQLISVQNISKMLIDGQKPKWYEQRLKKVLRDKGIAVKKLRTVRSKSEFGIQLADAIAGLVRYCYDYPDISEPRKILKKLQKEGLIFGIFLLESATLNK